MAVVPPVPRYKVVFLGDESVGKSSIITRFMYDKFDPLYQATDGIDFLFETMYLEDRSTIRLLLWENSGQEKFRSLIPKSINDSSVASIVYDVTNQQSFFNASKWIEEVRTRLGSDVIIVLVGTKVDLIDKRQVSIVEGDAKAREHGVMFIETSAKVGFNVKPLFRKIASTLLQRETLSSTKQEGNVDDSSVNDKSLETKDIPDIAPMAVDYTNRHFRGAFSGHTAHAQTNDILSSIPASVSLARTSSGSSGPIMTIEELLRLGPWIVESMTLLGRSMRVQLPPFHYGQASLVPGTHHDDDDVNR